MEIENETSSNQSLTLTKSWTGSSISEICRGKGPWSFSISPVIVSKYHAVLYQLPASLKEPPKPHYTSNPQHWDENHVRMPYSEKNLYPVNENGKDVAKVRWNIIKESLAQPIKNSYDLEKAVHSYNNNLPKFLALHYLFEEVLEEDETEFFFENILPKIIKLALQLPEIVPGSFPLLKKDHNRSVSLSQLQIACLLANAFLCTFPWRKDVALSYPGVNFSRLFMANFREKRKSCVCEKLKCLIVYFRAVTDKSPVGVVTFERKFIPKSSMPRWDTSDLILGNTKVHIDSEGTIEGGLGFLQVDFANKNVGGGVLGYGCVQEEIRFVICPELIISRLFVEQLGDREAVIVTGIEQFSSYSGYGDTFQWHGVYQDTTPHDEYGRRRTQICIIDATRFNKTNDQYYPSAMLRELNKAYVGFSSREKDNVSPVATGNWGCGAFRGSTYLKALLQLMACTAAGRNLVYYTFSDPELRDQFYNMYMFIANHHITITQLWKFLSGFCQQKKIAPDKLYPYIQQDYYDSKKQPKIKKFFGVSFKKRDNIGPSTSGNIPNKKPTNENDNNKDIIEKSKEEETLEDLGELFDEDIIPGTPPEDQPKYKKNPPKFKSKLTPEEIAQKLPKTNIIEIIDFLDGTTSTKSPEREDDTFLSRIDKLSNKKLNNNSSRQQLGEECEVMDVDVDMEEDKTSPSPSCSEIKTTKKKISDYFQKSFKSS